MTVAYSPWFIFVKNNSNNTMKKMLKTLFFLSGWLLLALFLLSAYLFKPLSNTPIPWENHWQGFHGLIECSLSDSELSERKELLKRQVFSKLDHKLATENGFIYYFDDDPDLLNWVWELIEQEKACCPFFKFDLSILPFKQGFALQISGAPAAFELLKDFEKTDF